jgi:hypothetical protein
VVYEEKSGAEPVARDLPERLSGVARVVAGGRDASAARHGRHPLYEAESGPVRMIEHNDVVL